MLQPTMNSLPLEDFPAIDAAEVMRQVNRLFTPYLFIRHDRKAHMTEVQCSVCGGSGSLPDVMRTITNADAEIIWGRHNDEACCPYCGERMRLKEIGRLGQRKKLQEWHPVIILTERDGDIYARGYWARKQYKYGLTEPPEFMLTYAYHFTPGRATIYTSNGYSRSIEGNYDPVHRVITEPFTSGNYYYSTYESYAVIGLSEIEHSAFRYCGQHITCPGYAVTWGLETFYVQHDLMKFLAACCIYPRQIEMLNKTGFEDIVDEMVKGRRKSAAVFNWHADSYKDAFGLTRQEMQQWRDSGAPIQAIASYKSLRRAGQHPDFAQLAAIYCSYSDVQKFFKMARRAGLQPAELHRYLAKQIRDKRTAYPSWMLSLLADYYDMAQRLGWELGSTEAPWTPRDLRAKHDEAAEEQKLQEIRRRTAELAAKQAAAEESLARRREKYNAERGGYIIRIADTAEEIQIEGRTLHHCVGGYAERHLADKLTICFIRRAETPSAALYTVEMQGNRLIQIHGYKNDDDKPADQRPEAVMAWLLEPWLEWLRRGSPRDKNGQPRWPKTKKKEKNAA